MNIILLFRVFFVSIACYFCDYCRVIWISASNDNETCFCEYCDKLWQQIFATACGPCRICYSCYICYFFHTFVIAVSFKTFLPKLRRQFASKFLPVRSILDISANNSKRALNRGRNRGGVYSLNQINLTAKALT